jgi:hypothetical protein
MTMDGIPPVFVLCALLVEHVCEPLPTATEWYSGTLTAQNLSFALDDQAKIGWSPSFL